MKKLFVIVLLWATISIFSAGCVDVGNPTGNPNDPNQNNPDGNGGNDGNNNNDGNGGNDGNDGNSTLDPDDPMYPGEFGTYIMNWATYNTTITTQKYIGATYDDSNTANVPDRQDGDYNRPAPYKTTFSDGTMCYSIGPFVNVGYNEDSTQTDCALSGTAPNGFVVTDYKYDDDKNQVVYKEDPSSTESTGDASGTYTTYNYGVYITYVTKQPVLKVQYQKSNSGEVYYGRTGETRNYLYATKWSDGGYTLSLYRFSGLEYTYSNTAEFSYDSTKTYEWYSGTAQTGRKESDYTFNATTKEYQYTGGGNAAAGATAETGNAIEDILEDAEDILGDILDNDGLRIQR
jgi:hypothetical protein